MIIFNSTDYMLIEQYQVSSLQSESDGHWPCIELALSDCYLHCNMNKNIYVCKLILL